MRIVLLLTLTIFACRDAGSDDKAMNDYLVRSATKSVTELKQILAAESGKRPIDWGMVTRCADMANVATLEKANQALAAELRQLCTKDVPLAMMKFEAEQADAAVNAKPKAEFIPECHSPTFNFAKDQMSDAKTIDLAKDVIARFAAICTNR